MCRSSVHNCRVFVRRLNRKDSFLFVNLPFQNPPVGNVDLSHCRRQAIQGWTPDQLLAIVPLRSVRSAGPDHDTQQRPLTIDVFVGDDLWRRRCVQTTEGVERAMHRRKVLSRVRVQKTTHFLRRRLFRLRSGKGERRDLFRRRRRVHACENTDFRVRPTYCSEKIKYSSQLGALCLVRRTPY